eukprot:351595-Chlamydomonas_euryale.AAC.5
MDQGGTGRRKRRSELLCVGSGKSVRASGHACSSSHDTSVARKVCRECLPSRKPVQKSKEEGFFNFFKNFLLQREGGREG